MYKVEWVDLTMEEPEVITSVVDEEGFESLAYGEAVGVIHINDYAEVVYLKGLREALSKYLTENTKSGWATAIFDKDTGLPLWPEVRLDMIMQIFDEVIKEQL